MSMISLIIPVFNIWWYTCIHTISKHAKCIEVHLSHTVNTNQTKSCNDKSHYSLCIINENYQSTRLFSVKMKQIQSQQLVHITLYDSFVAT